MKTRILPLFLLFFNFYLFAESDYPFVKLDFKVPEILETSQYRLRMITINDAIKDYDAVMSSTKQLQTLWASEWPKGQTLEQNIIDLGWHQYEFQTRRSFAYTIVGLNEGRILGTVYIDPTRKADYDVSVHYWVRTSSLESGLEDELKKDLKKWLKDKWPFKRAAFPGREIDREVWLALPDVKR
jgi:hypothetical protein